MSCFRLCLISRYLFSNQAQASLSKTVACGVPQLLLPNLVAVVMIATNSVNVEKYRYKMSCYQCHSYMYSTICAVGARLRGQRLPGPQMTPVSRGKATSCLTVPIQNPHPTIFLWLSHLSHGCLNTIPSFSVIASSFFVRNSPTLLSCASRFCPEPGRLHPVGC